MTCTPVSQAKKSPRLGVYEQRLDRALHATLRQLQQLKKMRQLIDEEPAPEPEPEVKPENAASEETLASEPAGEEAGAAECASVQNEPTAGEESPPVEALGVAPEAPEAPPPATAGG